MVFARYPSGFSRNTIIQKLFVRRRMAARHLGIILEQFALDLQARGYALSTVQSYVQVTEHFSRWLGGRRLAVREIDERVDDRFVGGHLCRRRCPIPAATTGTICRAALGCFVRSLREQELASKSSPQLSDHEVLVERIASRFWLPEAGPCLNEMLPSIDARNATDGQGGTE